jgi:hypothetical protein
VTTLFIPRTGKHFTLELTVVAETSIELAATDIELTEILLLNIAVDIFELN